MDFDRGRGHGRDYVRSAFRTVYGGEHLDRTVVCHLLRTEA
jgi:hypothetical protein